MRQQEVLDKIREAEIVLVGIGEEFNDTKNFSGNEAYCRERELLLDSGYGFLVPLLERHYRKKCGARNGGADYFNSLERLAGALEGKNYFVVSVSVNSVVSCIPWKEGRLVMPCGSEALKQCVDGCVGGLGRVTEEELENLSGELPELIGKIASGSDVSLGLGVCPECGKPLQLNNIFHGAYDEKGYLEDWQRYTKWLQGTLNHKLLILELGVGMQFPSVVRWPFEKVAFFNQKAFFYRINEKLYQLTEELSGKGVGIPENMIDWLLNL